MVDYAKDPKYLQLSDLLGHYATNLNNAFEHHGFGNAVQKLNPRKLAPAVGNLGKPVLEIPGLLIVLLLPHQV